MITSSAKAKGRRLAQKIKHMLLKNYTGLDPDDIIVTSSGTTGSDLMFSPAAKDVVCLDTCECKNQERLNLWQAIKQAENHGGEWALFISRNRSPIYVLQSVDDWLKRR